MERKPYRCDAPSAMHWRHLHVSVHMRKPTGLCVIDWTTGKGGAHQRPHALLSANSRKDCKIFFFNPSKKVLNCSGVFSALWNFILVTSSIVAFSLSFEL